MESQRLSNNHESHRELMEELKEGCALATRAHSMSANSSSEHVLKQSHHHVSVPSSDVASSCVICNAYFSSCDLRQKPIVKASCNHLFQRECLKKWMITSDDLKCPL